MKCPDCKNNTKVLDSRLIGDRRIRRRHCTQCEYEMYTSEQKIDYMEGVALMNKWYENYYAKKSKEA